jgi:hypothetical protein
LFTVELLPPLPEAVKLTGGTVAEAVAQYRAGAGPALVPIIVPGLALQGAVLFIDQTQDALRKPAQTEFGWGGG